MKDEVKSKAQLIRELRELKARLARLEALEADHRQASAALRESEERFRLLYENAPLAYQSLDENGHVIEVNQAWLDLLGYARKEVVGRGFYEFLAPEYRNDFKEKFSLFKASGEVCRNEFELIRKDGSPVIVSVAGRIQLDGKGRFKQTHCIFHDMTEKKKADAVAAGKQNELATGFQIIGSILNTFDLEKRLKCILDAILVFFNVEFGGIQLVEDSRLVLRTWKGLSPRFRSHIRSLPLSDLPDWMVTPGVLHFGTAMEGPLSEFAGSEGIRSWRSIPLAIPVSEKEGKKRELGRIFLASRRVDALEDGKINAIYGMIDQLALAIDHAQVYRQARQRLARLETLHRIDRAIIQRLDLKKILYVVLDRIPKELGADAVAISLMNGEQGRPEVFSMRLPNGTVIEEEAFTLAESLFHWLVERKETVIIYELDEDPRLQMHWDMVRGNRLSSYLGVPLIVHEKSIGILHILTREPTVFKKEEAAFFKTLAGQVAIAIENARLFEATQRHAAELEKKVAELEQMAETLKKTQESLIDAQRIANLGSWEWMIAENKIVSSDAMFRLFGTRPEEFDGTFETALNYVHPADRQSVSRYIEEVLETGAPMDIEHRIVLPDGSERIVHERAAVFYDETGQPIRMVGTVQDITESKKLEQVVMLQEKMASLGHMAMGIAHEIRNPLSGINIFLDAIRESLKDPESVEDVADMIDEAKAASGKIEAVVKRIMDFARPGPARLKPIHINKPVREAIRLSSATMQRAGIGFEADLASNLPKIFADFQLIEQVILNLLSNALDAMKEVEGPKTLLVATDQKLGWVIITVRDSGPGIHSVERKRIFEPFYTTKKSGSGIGLSFCQKIIIDHGGHIDVSAPDNGGAEFTIWLPIGKRVGSMSCDLP